MAVYFRTVWNGWVVDARMKVLLRKQDKQCRPCVMNCGYDEDAVEHYGRCKVFWKFVSMPRPSGLGLPLEWRSAEAFLAVRDGMVDEDKVRMVLGMYALYRTVQ